MEDSHFIQGVKQRVWLSERNQDLPRDTETIEDVLNESLEMIDEGFSPQNIEALRGAPDEIVEAASGESIEELEVETIAEYLSTEKWNYRFNADVSAPGINVEDANFDIWHDGSLKVRVGYENPNDLDPGIRAVKETYPNRDLSFDAALFSRKPEEAEEVYNEAVEAKRKALFNALVEDPASAEDILDENIDSENKSRQNMSNFIGDFSQVALQSVLHESDYGEESEDLAREAQALVLDDAFKRFRDYGILLHQEEDYETYDGIVNGFRAGEVDPAVINLVSPNGAELEFISMAEGSFGLSFVEPSDVGYQLRSQDEEGLEVINDFYVENY